MEENTPALDPVDVYQQAYGVSRFTAVLRTGGIPEEDFEAVCSYATFLQNTWRGARPSDCARRAVREYHRAPDTIRHRERSKPPEWRP